MVQIFANPLWSNKTVNAVKRTLLLPCSIPKSIYVETAFDAAMTAFTSLRGPDPRHLYHKAFGQSALCEVKTGINQALQFANVDGGIVKRTLFQFAELADVATFWLFIAGVAGDFLFDWASGVYKMNPCSPVQHPNSISGYDPYGATYSDGTWGVFDFFLQPPHLGAGQPFEILLPGETAIVAASVTAQDATGVPVPVNTRIVVDNGEILLDQHQGSQQVIGGVGAGYNHSHTFASWTNPIGSGRNRQVSWQCTNSDHLPHNECFALSGTAFWTKY